MDDNVPLKRLPTVIAMKEEKNIILDTRTLSSAGTTSTI